MFDYSRIHDLEDYEEAYYSRKDDFESLSGLDRKIMKMHWGGVIIECFVKHLIVQKYCLEKMIYFGEWYSQYALSELERISNERRLTSNDYRRYACKCKGHDFRIWIKELLELDTENVNEDLEILYNPFGESNRKFIDLRYESEDKEEIDICYSRWEIAYEKVSKWLKGCSENINREDCKTW